MSEPDIKPIEHEGKLPMCSAECPQAEYSEDDAGRRWHPSCTIYTATDCGDVCVPAVLRMAAIIEKLRGAADKAVAMVSVCGHTATCTCCWCRMRETLREVAEAAKEKNDASD